MIYLQIFWVFFISNFLGYGGGPSILPLIEFEVVNTFGWMTAAEFTEVVAMGNAIPGPIAPKIAAFIGFDQAGVLGSLTALVATIAPSMILMVLLMGLLKRYKDSPGVQRLTRYIRPTIAVLLGEIAIRNLLTAWGAMSPVHFFVLAVASLVCLTKLKAHPAFVVLGALIYGAIFLAH